MLIKSLSQNFSLYPNNFKISILTSHLFLTIISHSVTGENSITSPVTRYVTASPHWLKKKYGVQLLIYKMSAMQLVRYAGGKRYRLGDEDTTMVPFSNSSRLFNPSYGSALGRYSRRRGSYKNYRRSRYRSLLNNFNTRTNPVYPRPEVKVSDTTFGTIGAGIAIPSTGTAPVCMNNLGSGTFPGQRVGAQISSKSVYYQFVINFGSASAAIAVRFILWWDRQMNGILPTNLASVLDNPTLGIVSPLLLSNRNRYFILADERVTLSPQGTNIQYISGFRKINQLSTYDQTGSVNYPLTGGLLYAFISDEPSTSSTTNPTYYGVFRFRYMDT